MQWRARVYILDHGRWHLALVGSNLNDVLASAASTLEQREWDWQLLRDHFARSHNRSQGTQLRIVEDILHRKVVLVLTSKSDQLHGSERISTAAEEVVVSPNILNGHIQHHGKITLQGPFHLCRGNTLGLGRSAIPFDLLSRQSCGHLPQ